MSLSEPAPQRAVPPWPWWAGPLLIAGLSILIVLALSVTYGSARRDAWTDWCAGQGGQVVDSRRLPPGQLDGGHSSNHYCLQDGSVIGAYGPHRR